LGTKIAAAGHKADLVKVHNLAGPKDKPPAGSPAAGVDAPKGAKSKLLSEVPLIVL